jgi:hypothetical protein
MKTSLILCIVCFAFVGYGTTRLSDRDIAALHDVKEEVMQLHRGMKREDVEATLHPQPSPSLPFEFNISGIVGVQYLLRPGVWVQVDYDSFGSLVITPSELEVIPGNRPSGKYIPLSQIP